MAWISGAQGGGGAREQVGEIERKGRFPHLSVQQKRRLGHLQHRNDLIIMITFIINIRRGTFLNVSK